MRQAEVRPDIGTEGWRAGFRAPNEGIPQIHSPPPPWSGQKDVAVDITE